MSGQVRFTERQIETLKRHAAEKTEQQCRQHNAQVDLADEHNKQFGEASQPDNVIPIRPS